MPSSPFVIKYPSYTSQVAMMRIVVALQGLLERRKK